MKRLASIALAFSAVAVLGATLTGASPNEVATESDKPCCQKNLVSPKVAASKSVAPHCCLEAKTNTPPASEAKSCCGDSCKVGKNGAGTCKECTEKSLASDMASVTKINSAATVCDDGACPSCQDIASCCKSSVTTDLVSASVDDEQTCKNCKEECSTCAEARKSAETAKDDQAASVGEQAGTSHGMGRGHAGDSQHQKDHQDFFYLIENRDSIRRTVKNIPKGVETLTESDDRDVASMIQTHVEAMYGRMENVNPIRMQDPLFREVFMNAKKIKMKVEHTDHGVRVTETSDDTYAVKLIQAHAKVVSLWIKNGYKELPKNHAAPAR